MQIQNDRTSPPSFFLPTSDGKIAYKDTLLGNHTVVCIHGNSGSSRVFDNLVEKLKGSYRIISIDLLGHGKSDNSSDPFKSYTVPAYAKMVDTLAEHLNLKSYAVIGHSLGGNIALQLTQLTDKVSGVVLVSTAPIPYSEEALKGYIPFEGNYGRHPESLSKAQAEVYMNAVGVDLNDPTQRGIVQDAMRTDPKTRELMVASVLKGCGVDETEILKVLEPSVAVIEAENEIAIQEGYLDSLEYRSLWKEKVQKIPNVEHSSILFNKDNRLSSILLDFFEDVFQSSDE